MVIYLKPRKPKNAPGRFKVRAISALKGLLEETFPGTGFEGAVSDGSEEEEEEDVAVDQAMMFAQAPEPLQREDGVNMVDLYLGLAVGGENPFTSLMVTVTHWVTHHTDPSPESDGHSLSHKMMVTHEEHRE